MVTLVRANNPSAMTLTGTNSYVIDCGDGEALVIDPGPPFEEHLQALIGTAASQGLTIAAIALSHAHPDHAMGAPHLSAATGAPVYAHPRSRAPHDLDLPLESDLRAGATCASECIDAPGHSDDHAIFYLERGGRALYRRYDPRRRHDRDRAPRRRITSISADAAASGRRVSGGGADLSRTRTRRHRSLRQKLPNTSRTGRCAKTKSWQR